MKSDQRADDPAAGPPDGEAPAEGLSLKVDGVVALVLCVAAFLVRRRVPPDGFFFDDAWQALAAAKGTWSQFTTVGQTQPAFGIGLMAWSRVVGTGTASMVTPALIAGSLGPPALFLVLRRLRFRRSVAVLLGAALTVAATHIIYSTRVKAYTGEVLIVLLVVLLVPRLIKRQWTVSTALVWLAGSVAVASYSSFALLVSAAAGIVAVLHSADDRRIRLAAVGAQAAVLVGILAAVDRTHDQTPLNSYFKSNRAFLDFQWNPFAMARDLFDNLVRVVRVFPGGPSWTPEVCAVLAVAGLVVACLAGSRRVVARLMAVMVVIAVLGAFAHRVPFGPDVAAYRATIWLTPVIAFGLAVVLERIGRLAARTRTSRTAFDVALFVAAGLLLLTPIGVYRPYPNAARAATHEVMATIGPTDAVLITRPAMYSFAYYADTRVRLQAAPERIQGFIPRFADRRLHAVDFLGSAQRRALAAAVSSADRVFVVDSNNDPQGYKTYRIELALAIKSHGFEVESTRTVQRASITVWRRTSAGT